MRRIQIHIDDTLDAAVRAEAARRGVSRAALIRSRASPMVNCGMSMPVTSSSALRNGVDEGQAASSWVFWG